MKKGSPYLLVVLRHAICWAAILAAGAACSKNLGQILLAPPVETRTSQSLYGGLATPATPTPGSTTDFYFAVFGDPQIRSENISRLAAFKTDAIARGVSFFVVLGDLTEDATTDQYTKIKSALDGVGIPYFATIGNHDLFQSGSAGGWDSWKSTFGPATYSLTVAGVVRFLMIDTASGDIGRSQFDWLESQLRTPIAFNFVGSHYSLYDGITPVMWRISSVEERYKLMGIMDKYGVYAYVGGHVHGYRQTQVGSTLHFTIGSMYPYTLDYGNAGYVLFHYKNGAMTWEFVQL